jgi:5'-nucleotidase
MPRTPARIRIVGALALTSSLAVAAVSLPAGASPQSGKHGGSKRDVTVQILSFNDYHGHLQATDPPITNDPAQTPVGGAEYLASTLDRLRDKVGDRTSVTVAAGDLIGGSTFLSGLFHDEPSVETLETMGLDFSSVGNHEFDEGTAELLRMQRGGCHPEDGCYFPDDPYDGAGFRWLAANVVRKDNGRPLLPATAVRRVNGVKVGFIGMTLEETPTLVNPAGVSSVEFRDEVETANAHARLLRKQGVEAIVVMVHEGIMQTGTYNQCSGISGPMVDIASRLHPEIDLVVTGHTHEAYLCSLPDPSGSPRMVTSAASWGRAVTETKLVIDKRSGDVIRHKVRSTNHLVTRDDRDPAQTKIIEKWEAIAAPLAARVVGNVLEDITGDASTCRCAETPTGDLVADAILWGTSGASGGSQVAFMNIGGVRASLTVAPKYDEGPGEVTYAEAYDVAPFGNLLVSMDLTGAQIEQVLEQQYVPTRSRPYLALGVSAGFSYTWDDTQPEGQKVVPGSMTLDGVPIDPNATYRVATIGFLASGGDAFTGFTAGSNLLGGAEDLANLVDYLEAHPDLRAPADRVSGL